MTNFRQNRNKKARNVIVLSVVLCALFFVFLFAYGAAGRAASSSASVIFSPFLKAGDSASGWFAKKLSYFKEKQSLEEDNRSLKEKVRELESGILFCNILEEENNRLKEAFSRKEDQNYIIAFVISRPPKSPYDILIIDAGSENGIQNGMEISAYGNILIGYAVEVNQKTSKVKLVSFPKEEISAMLMDANVPAVAIGQGAGNFEIDLPKAVEVKEGDKVVTLGINPLLLGIVEKIISNPSDPFQKILFRLPINIQELNYVMVKI